MNVEQAIIHLRYRNVTNKERFTEAIDVLENEINRQKAEIERLTNKLEQREEMMANLGVELTTMRGAANSYKAKVERLQKENKRFADIGKMYSEIRAESIKEFSERLKEELRLYTENNGGFVPSMIDNLVKEMVGEKYD